MTADEVVERAREAVLAARRNGGIRYALGQGGMTPSAPFPWTYRGLDCTGFAAWSLGISRKDSRIQGGWIESTAIVRDGLTRGGIFTVQTEPLPGDLLAYGDEKVGSRVRQGHVGVVLEVEGDRVTEVAHCSSGNFSSTNNALLITGPQIFDRRGAVVVRFDEIGQPTGAGKATVTATRLNVRESGAMSARIITQVDRGTVLPIVQRGGEWTKIRLASGAVAFVATRCVEVTA